MQFNNYSSSNYNQYQYNPSLYNTSNSNYNNYNKYRTHDIRNLSGCANDMVVFVIII